MCNLYGVYKRFGNIESTPNIITNSNLLKARGRDSFGTVVVDNDGIWQTVNPEPNLGPSKDFLYLGILSRAIPEPELIEHEKEGLNHDRDTQPFVNADWVVSHNGTIINPDLVKKEHKLNTTSPVDSALLPELFSKYPPEEAIKKIDGSFAIAAYGIKNRTLYLMANFQPLYYVEAFNYIYYASLPEQLLDAGRPIQKLDPYTCLIFQHERKRKVSLYREQVNNQVLVVASGGLDSITTARLYQVLGYEVSLVHYLYSQAAESVELEMIKKIAKEYNWPLMILDVRGVFREAAKSSRLLNNTKPMQDALEDAESSKPSYVGNRNMIFSSIAAGIAEENKIGRVVLGLNLSDGGGYPDNCLPYLINMEETLQTSLNQQSRVFYRSPFVNLMKHEVLQVAFAIGSPLHLQASCYYPTLQENGLPKYCTGCGSHLLRSYAFKYLKVKDPVPYEENFNWDGCKELPQEVWDKINNKELRLKPEEIPFYDTMKRTL